MRKGNDGLTYKQLKDGYERMRRENAALRKEVEKLKNDLHSRTVAFNKLLKGE